MSYYDQDGKPMTMEAWGKAFENTDTRIIGHDEFGEVMVSTVWLGIDHSHDNGPPVIFETMIFGGDHDQEQWRYSTREDAKSGHAQACDLVKPERD